MGWAAGYIAKLRAGETVSFRPRGNSMRGKVESGQLVTVEPIPDPSVLEPGQIVLCRVRGAEYLHLILATEGKGSERRFQIGNNRGGINGWVSAHSLYGKCVKIEA